MYKLLKILIYVLISAVILVSASLLVLYFLEKSSDTWVCKNSQWVKQGNPQDPAPSTPCIDKKDNDQNLENQDEIIVEFPKAGDIVHAPLEIKGKATGSWFFEASFPIKLIDENKKIIATGYAQTESDWMTDQMVPFSAVINYNLSQNTLGKLVLEKDNPSGLPQNDENIEIPLTFEASENITFKIFFSNSDFDEMLDCQKVYQVQRVVPKTQAVGSAALEELLKGPTQQEKDSGYFTNINEGVEINSLVIEDNIATVNFSESIEQGVGGSCKVSAIRSQIEETLKQFSTVDQVIIQVNGRQDDVLQP